MDLFSTQKITLNTEGFILGNKSHEHMNKSQPQALKTVFSFFLPPTCFTEEGNQYQLHKRFLSQHKLVK